MMLQCGIDGYVTMHEKPADLVKIIQSVMDQLKANYQKEKDKLWICSVLE